MATGKGLARDDEQGPAHGDETDDAVLRLQKAFSSPAVGVLSFKLGGSILDEAHGGHVGVTSSAAAGTTFTVMLPRQVG